MAEADRAGEEQRPARPLHRAHPGALARRAADELAQRAVEGHRVARRGDMAATGHREHLRTRHQRMDLLPLGVRDAPIIVAVDHQRRAADAARQFAHVVVHPRVAAPVQPLGVGGPAVVHTVLVRLGRMRLAEDGVHEPVDIGRPVAAQQFALHLHALREFLVARQRVGKAAGRDHVRHPLRLFGRQPQHGQRCGRDADQRHALGADRIEHGHEVGVEVLEAVGVLPLRPIGAAVAATVGGDDTKVPRQVRHRGLEHLAVHDLQRRRKGDPGAAIAPHRVPDLHAVTIDETLVRRRHGGVRRGAGIRHRAGLGQRAGNPVEAHGQGAAGRGHRRLLRTAAGAAALASSDSSSH